MGETRACVGGLFPVLILLALFAFGCEEESREDFQTAKKAGEDAVVLDVQEKAPEDVETTAAGRLKLHSPKPGHRGIPSSFSWNLFPGAETYQLLVLNSEEMVLYEGPRFVENLTALPEGWDDDVPEGVCYWQVLAFDAEGNEISTSPYRDFILLKE